jgi:Carboxypeptidase regulatory-like domain
MKKETLKPLLAGVLLAFCLLGSAVAQRDANSDPTADLSFLILRDESGKPVRNAAVIMHPVNDKGKQSRGGLELKTDSEGKASFDGVPYGKLRVQVLASGFQTFGEDYDVDRAKMDFTIKLKRPQSQYSIYPDHPDQKKDDKSPPPDPNAKPQ